MARPATITILEYKQVVSETEGKTDIVSRWARRGVIAQARMDTSYLKRRLNSLYADFPLPKGKIADCEGFIRDLKSIIDTELW